MGPLVEYLLLSDVHLTQVLESPIPGWWEYKKPSARQDDELVELLDQVDAVRPAAFACTEVVFGGDTWDFDSVYGGPGDLLSPSEGLPPTVPGSVWKMRRLLGDHEPFVFGLARFLARGNRVTFLMGNHDRELAFPEVAEVLRLALAAAAPPGTGARVAAAVAFEPWFLYVPGVLYAEHGQQYDATCSYRDVLAPFVPAHRRAPRALEASMGSLMGRHVLSSLGSFNPFDDDSFLKSLSGYARHAYDYYFPKRRFLSIYVGRAFRVVRLLRQQRRRVLASKPDSSATYAAYARSKGVGADFIALLRRLGSVPISDRPRHLLHELWLDRLLTALAAALIVGAGIANAETWPQAAMMLALIPPLLFVLRAMGRGSLALQERGRWGLVAEQISTHLDVPIVCFGHSHRPERRPLRNGGRYYNLGTWAPVPDPDGQQALIRARRYLLVRHVGPGRTHVAFQRWRGDGPDANW
ncbi:MAG: hypothetical protein H6744_16385 [Deltaproteobacteria bacterium]|nr:hypothetical protein [Deltaproteobacteria bacterium]MCB9788260.1 hypothetical protein [Deltaproteobacteria bacterium]